MGALYQCRINIVSTSYQHDYHFNINLLYIPRGSFSIFFRYGKNYLMSSLAMSVRPSSVEITLGRGSDKSAEPIDLKIGINMGNWVVHV